MAEVKEVPGLEAASPWYGAQFDRGIIYGRTSYIHEMRCEDVGSHLYSRMCCSVLHPSSTSFIPLLLLSLHPSYPQISPPFYPSISSIHPPLHPIHLPTSSTSPSLHLCTTRTAPPFSLHPPPPTALTSSLVNPDPIQC
ncbi:hypothetical protein NHX12_023459 [Muraenolepis orangiensis]|uniref:Uncharacterized protein n=1 Tax=Muraenolepis orangiensis TaxID=630683 RepID=A0A9Q0EL40_9TELE|nr:hypothetical protein NHX12_023459 [Muraenolepis orangiensis]